MSTPAEECFWTLTEKEKQTLRLIVRGHDAKSVARNLGLSVHTINERLRDARRKMAVSSSREAARLLFAAEGQDGASPTPDFRGDVEIGEDPTRAHADKGKAPIDGVGPAYRYARIIIGGFIMTIALGLMALAALSQTATAPSPTPAAEQSTPDAAVVDAARQWLVLLDQSRWDDSYRATGAAFRQLNTVQVWAAASERVRTPLGALISRSFVSQENLPAPPSGYEVVKFRSRFANKADAVETVTLSLEKGVWRVVGVTVG